jgi:sortase A
MAPLIATAFIVLMVAALSVYGPLARPQPPAHLHASAGMVAVPPHTGNRALDAIVGALRSRPWARMALTTASVALVVGAIGMIGYPFYTNLYQDRVQARLDRQIQSAELRQAYLDHNVGIGDSLTRIVIPDIDVDVVVVEGTTASALRAGAGHYPDTPLPCEIGNVAIAGHRTTYGRPFHNVDELEVGQEITLETPIGTCTYEINKEPFPVSPKQLEVVANTPDEATLTLTTCHPKGSARERLIVQATLVRSDVPPANGGAAT